MTTTQDPDSRMPLSSDWGRYFNPHVYLIIPDCSMLLLLLMYAAHAALPSAPGFSLISTASGNSHEELS